ncbi:MAG: hypothetical protein RLZZ44_681 [Bacteroidota bacterium]
MYQIPMKVSKFYFILVLLLQVGLSPLFAQTSDEKFRKPIVESIKKIEEIFKVTIEDKRKLLEGKELNYADWRIQQGNLEISLTQILAPFDLTFYKEADGKYIIRKFEYHKVSVSKGQDKLNYLSTLYSNAKDWEVRRNEIKKCMFTSLGLDKAPATPKSKPILTPKRNYGDYTVENIGLEILPGVYVTGSIYKPYPLKGKHPIVLTPDGHFLDERYRKDEQYRCAILAKMGAIVVGYDLFAWGESKLQFPVATHQNSIASTVEVLSGIRLLDYLVQLKEADPSRIGVTGGSGGGSHTMFLAALDDRVTVSAPVVMVSSYFSGGCPCESGRGIHLCVNGTNNAEIAAIAAPRPQLLISDGEDWTKDVPQVEFPFIQRTYGFYDKKGMVQNAHFAQEGHDYGVSKRMALYPFMAQHLGLNMDKVKNSQGEIDESTCVMEPKEKLLVFGNQGEKFPATALKDIDQLYEMFGEKNNKEHEVSK